LNDGPDSYFLVSSFSGGTLQDGDRFCKVSILDIHFRDEISCLAGKKVIFVDHRHWFLLISIL